MKDYLKEAIVDFGKDIVESAALPAERDLFDIKEDSTSPVLPPEKQETFHRVVAKLLYVLKRGRLDIQLTTAFLCMRVSCSTTQDWEKLKRLLIMYLRGTLDEFLVLGADDLTIMKTWVDASYGVHKDFKSHTGGAVSFSQGAVMYKSVKQKLSTKSSTEAELVGASDYLCHVQSGERSFWKGKVIF
jgi:hypothetical protein